MQKSYSRNNSGFTIVELLVVIVVIGILAAITIISYTGINQKAVVSTLQSDLSNAQKQISMYRVVHSSYPTAFDADDCPSAPTADTDYCLKSSGDNSYTNYVSDGTFYTLAETNTNGTVYSISDDSAPLAGAMGPNWFAGADATVMAGKYVRKTDLSGTYQYKLTNTSVEAPQGATGLDPNYPLKISLVNPQTNPTVDFSEYSAQNACKSIGGRLPYMNELLSIYANKASYGTFQNAMYWSSTENDSTSGHLVNFGNGSSPTSSKTNNVYLRCVAD